MLDANNSPADISDLRQLLLGKARKLPAFSEVGRNRSTAESYLQQLWHELTDLL